ncbi:putative transporter [Hibiscus syriacus]|uniref:starch synthase n=1 Tax=Hibiscus syriacus TaxID=106335 RepID=A0A6A2ZPA3_HIBSY|nr:putative transporter [Hibiscus syriacus]
MQFGWVTFQGKVKERSRWYASLDEVQGLREVEAQPYSYFNGQLHGNKIWTGVVYGIGVTFIQLLYFSSFFNRDRIYGYPDDFERNSNGVMMIENDIASACNLGAMLTETFQAYMVRTAWLFTYFSRASLDYIAKSGKQSDVLHLHNWENAIVGPIFWDIFANQMHPLTVSFSHTDRTCWKTYGSKNSQKTAVEAVLMRKWVDDLRLVEPDKLALCGLDPGRLDRPDRLQDTAKTHLVNILKVGCIISEESDFDLEKLQEAVQNAISLKALRYGAAPVLEASSDGNFRYYARHDHEITRFLQFTRSTFGIMSLSQALDEIRNNPSTWKTKISNAMKEDFSWDSECYETHVSAYSAIKSL